MCTNQPTFYGHFQKVNIYFLYEHQSTTTTINIIDPRNASDLNAARTQLVNILHDILTNKAINFLTKQNSRTTTKNSTTNILLWSAIHLLYSNEWPRGFFLNKFSFFSYNLCCCCQKFTFSKQIFIFYYYFFRFSRASQRPGHK